MGMKSFILSITWLDGEKEPVVDMARIVDVLASQYPIGAGWNIRSA